MARLKAFTMIELLMVVIILGILGSIALPLMTGSKERAIFSEAISAAQVLYAAEARYILDHAGIYNGTCSNLDVDVSPQNFTTTCNVGSVAGNIGIARSTGTYTLYVSTAGAYTCPSCSSSLKKLCPNTCP